MIDSVDFPHKSVDGAITFRKRKYRPLIWRAEYYWHGFVDGCCGVLLSVLDWTVEKLAKFDEPKEGEHRWPPQY